MSNSKGTRRGFLHQVGGGTAAAVTAVSVSAAQAAEAGAKIKIVGVSTSLRKGKTTAAAVQRVLEAAKAVAPDRIEIELIELAGLKMPVDILVGGTLRRLTATQRGARGRRAPRWVAVKRANANRER